MVSVSPNLILLTVFPNWKREREREKERERRGGEGLG
jgi:hypothetical protein